MNESHRIAEKIHHAISDIERLEVEDNSRVAKLLVETYHEWTKAPREDFKSEMSWDWYDSMITKGNELLKDHYQGVLDGIELYVENNYSFIRNYLRVLIETLDLR